jgi:hypothetical protein
MPKGRKIVLFGGSIYLAKGKHLEKWENSSNLEMLLKNPFLYFWPKANQLEKILSKVCKTKCKWCKYGPKF